MKCGVCGSAESSVLESRPYYGSKVIVRRRVCTCGNRWTTDEKKRRGSDSTPWAEAPPATGSVGNRTSDPPHVAGPVTAQPAIRGVLGGLGGSLSPPVLTLSVLGPPDSLEANPQGIVDVMSVLAHYKRLHPRARPGQKEKRLVKARLSDGYSAAELCRAIDGYHSSAFHCGQNDTGQAHLSLELMVRDPKHVQAGLEFLERPQTTPVPKNGAAVAAFIARENAK